MMASIIIKKDLEASGILDSPFWFKELYLILLKTRINRGNPARKIDQCIKRCALSKEIDKRRLCL